MFTLYLELRTAGLNYPCKVADEIGLWHCFMKHGTSLDVISFPGYKNGICWSLITLNPKDFCFGQTLQSSPVPGTAETSEDGWRWVITLSSTPPNSEKQKKLNILPNQTCFDWIIFITQPLGSSTPSTYSPLPVFRIPALCQNLRSPQARWAISRAWSRPAHVISMDGWWVFWWIFHGTEK